MIMRKLAPVFAESVKKQPQQNNSPQRHRGTENTEFFFVNSAYGAVNNKSFFLCALCASVVKCFLFSDCQIRSKLLQLSAAMICPA
ncbi:MAG: hypothetical protein DRQ44_13475 [Gammaproteobacteria bacterium]|nr:MAG: hypothetical protein DRQ44_13475 [Gammaproteobacteria bacterium]